MQPEFRGCRDLRCPECNNVLRLEILKIGGVEIDRCSACRGIWLDVGEFEAMRKFKERGPAFRVSEIVDGVATAADPMVTEVVLSILESAGEVSKEAAGAVVEALGEILGSLLSGL